MRKYFNLFLFSLLAVICFAVLPNVNAKAATSIDNFKVYYDTESHEAHIQGYIGTKGDIEIPVYAKNGYPITCICDRAFRWNEVITSVKFATGSKVKYTGDLVFEGCKNLKSITLPASLISLGYSPDEVYTGGVFEGCSSLESIVIPSKVTYIYGSTFNGCTSLKSVSIPSGVTVIDHNAFRNCSSLTSLVIPAGVTEIGGECFYGCSSLTSIIIPKGVKVIGFDTFANCTNLQTVKLPSGLESIKQSAFENCSKLTTINIPVDLSDIAFYVFKNCTALRTIKFGDGFANNYHIGGDIFAGCSSRLVVDVVGGSPMESAMLNQGVNTHVYAKTIRTANVSDINDITYKAAYVKPLPVVKVGSKTLKKDIDYTLTYSNNKNVGEGTITIKGIGTYVGTLTKKFRIVSRDISTTTVKLQYTRAAYNAEYRYPTVKVTYNGVTLSSDNYSVSYSYNRNVGTANVYVYGKGNLKNSVTKNFDIVPKKTKITAYANTSTGIKIRWKEIPEATGYYIYRDGTLIKTITGRSTVTYVDTATTNSLNGKAFVYKVKPFTKVGTKYYKATVSDGYTAYRMKAPASVSLVTANSVIRLNMTTPSEIGYEIYRSKDGGSTYEKIASVLNNTYRNTGLIRGKRYYYKVKSYKTINGVKVYSAFSPVKSIVCA